MGTQADLQNAMPGSDAATAAGSGIEAPAFGALRPYLFSIAYRLLGSAADAEDVLQDAYLRARNASVAEIRAPRAFLATVVTRLCLDRLKSARVARETYVGPWLPEPVPTTDLAPAPTEEVERREQVSLAFLVLLQRLTPEERAAYVLREAFEYPYDELAAILGKSAPATRQLVHRARLRVAEGRPRFTASPEEQRRLTERFLAAAREGDVRALVDVLAPDATLWSDGGAKARAARRPITGADRIVRWLVGVLAKVPADARASLVDLNGQTGIAFWSGADLISATIADGAGGRIHAIRTVVNPDKLAYLQRRLVAAGQLPS
jgi:RNA polymerase sigma-70 factor (ECF subfamily)